MLVSIFLLRFFTSFIVEPFKVYMKKAPIIMEAYLRFEKLANPDLK